MNSQGFEVFAPLQKTLQNKIKKHSPKEIYEIKKDLFLDLILLLDYDSRLEDFEDFL